MYLKERPCEFSCVCVYILNMPVLKNMSTFFKWRIISFFSDLARPMRSGQTVSCRNCIKCSICGFQRQQPFHVLSFRTNNTIFAFPLMNAAKKSAVMYHITRLGEVENDHTILYTNYPLKKNVVSYLLMFLTYTQQDVF